MRRRAVKSSSTTGLLEVLDPDHKPMAAMPQETVHAQNLPHHRVAVLVYTRARTLYVPRRSKKRSNWAMCWDVSVSEHLQAGGSFYETARHGVRSQLGLTVSKLRFVLQIHDHRDRDNEILTVFTLHSQSQAPSPDPFFYAQGMHLEAHEIEYLVHTYPRHTTPILQLLCRQGILFDPGNGDEEQ